MPSTNRNSWFTPHVRIVKWATIWYKTMPYKSVDNLEFIFRQTCFPKNERTMFWDTIWYLHHSYLYPETRKMVRLAKTFIVVLEPQGPLCGTATARLKSSSFASSMIHHDRINAILSRIFLTIFADFLDVAKIFLNKFDYFNIILFSMFSPQCK